MNGSLRRLPTGAPDERRSDDVCVRIARGRAVGARRLSRIASHVGASMSEPTMDFQHELVQRNIDLTNTVLALREALTLAIDLIAEHAPKTKASLRKYLA